MSRESFMKKLIIELQLYFNSEEIGEIVDDCNEFFSIGLADGKNEEELCEYFGNPKDIVKNIRIESGKRKKGEFSLSFLARVITAILIFLYMINFFSRVSTNTNIQNESILVIIIVGLLLWFILGEKILINPTNYNIKDMESGECNRKIISIHLVLIVLVFLNYMFIFTASYEGTHLYDYFLNIEVIKIGILVSSILYLMVLLGLLLFIYSIYKLCKSSKKYYTIIFHILGYITFILSLINMLHRIVNIENIRFLMLRSLYPYLAGLFLSIIASVYIHRFSYYKIKTRD